MKNKGIDLPEETVRQMSSIFASYPEIEKVIIFGSRVLGNAKPGSDVDCALCGKDLTQQVVDKVHNLLEEETLIPYFFDCILLKDIQNKGLRKHIDKQGKILYERKTSCAETTTRNKKNIPQTE